MRKRTYLLWKRILLRLTIVFIIGGALYTYFYTGFFTVNNYIIVGAPDAYTLDLKRHMTELADQKLYKILPGNRSISYHDSAIRALILDTLPNTKSVSIHPANLHTLTVKLEAYMPLFSVNDGYAISSDATVYKEITPLDDFPHLEIASTTQVTSATLLAVSELSQKVETILFKIKFISIDEYGDVRLYNENKTSYVSVAGASDETKVWSNILSAVDTDPLKKNLSDNLSGLEYIDARFGNKVFYKFTNASKPAIIPTYATGTAQAAIQ
jgi:hypothetical protein